MNPFRRSNLRCLASCCLGSLALASALSLLATASVAQQPPDLRSTVRFRYQCANDFGRREITLFGNGTVRLREGLWQEQRLYLDELGPSDLESYLRRLQRIIGVRNWDTGPSQILSGDWIEECELLVDLPDEESFSYEFGRYDIPPLLVASLIQVADELATFTRPVQSPRRLPVDYRPQRGDILRRDDDTLMRVVGLTDDGQGIEMESLAEPLRIFYRLQDLRQIFVAVESDKGL